MKNRALFYCMAVAVAVINAVPAFVYAEDAKPKESTLAPPADASKDSRNFYNVLEDLLSDFEFDLKNNDVVGLRDLSIRNIATSENIPASFKAHLELLISERIMRITKTRMVHCLACRSKRASLSGENVVISNPESNSNELTRIAKMNGIQNFLDIAYAYQPTGMIMSLSINDAETGTTLWSRSYNSESSRSAAYRRGVDYSQLDEARTRSEYVPTVQMRPILYTVYTPKPGGGYTTALSFGFRMVERYDNRRKEVGFEMNYYYDTSSLIGLTDASVNSLYAGTVNLTMLFTHAWNLIGDEENFNHPRASILGQIGGTYASGYLGAVIRGGYEWRFAKHWALTTFLSYRPAATVVLPLGGTAALSGIEGGIGVGYLF